MLSRQWGGSVRKGLSCDCRESGLFCGDTCCALWPKAICRLLNADVALVGLLDGPERVRTLGAARRGSPLGNFEYVLRGTPCHDVTKGGACLLPSGVQECFPEDLLLADLGIDGYAGVRLLDSNGHVLGVMAALFERPIQDVAMVESVLQLFSTRTAVEIERSQMEASLRESGTRSLLEAMAAGEHGGLRRPWRPRQPGSGAHPAPRGKKIVGLEDVDPQWTHWRKMEAPGRWQSNRHRGLATGGARS